MANCVKHASSLTISAFISIAKPSFKVKNTCGQRFEYDQHDSWVVYTKLIVGFYDLKPGP